MSLYLSLCLSVYTCSHICMPFLPQVRSIDCAAETSSYPHGSMKATLSANIVLDVDVLR